MAIPVQPFGKARQWCGIRSTRSDQRNALVASSIAIATWTALVGVLLISFGQWQKARLEERFLIAELGAEAYGAYSRRVPMIVPPRLMCYRWNSAHQIELAGADIEREYGGVGDVKALDLAGHVEPRHRLASLARELPQTLAFGAEHERERLAQRHT